MATLPIEGALPKSAPIAAIAGLLLLGVPALAQHNHNAGHNDYLGWASGKVANCCNNQDCGVLGGDEHRDGPTGPEVKISGQWCPVLHEHFLVKGRSPDWNTPHACIRRGYDPEPCSRLLCYSGKGGV